LELDILRSAIYKIFRLIDKIKIDRSFVSNLSRGKESIAILHAITSLAGTLNMTTTAEGVETEAQLEIVRSEGCTEMQGYLFSPPVRKEMLKTLFERRLTTQLVAAE
jgi:EAL domain-containing protein (putative c-di-GMP-specific phosphodiesterase class I)